MPEGIIDAIKKLASKKMIEAEKKVTKWLGDPMKKGAVAGEKFSEDGDEGIDNFRHPMSARYTSEAIQKKTGNIPVVSNALGFMGGGMLGAAHELSTVFNDKRPWKVKLQESGEDMINNLVGAAVGSTPFISSKQKTDFLSYLSANNMLPDGIVLTGKYKNQNAYFKKNK
jgi:hypothetical protein|tara:strand:- start:16 stop:525 length:510 start_codon:yes stop_codon:yes gene_type:complete